MSRILLIDVRGDLVSLFKSMLEDEGYEALTRSMPFCSPKEIEALHPDLVVLGVTDDEEDFGRQTLDLLRSTSIRALAFYREPEYMLQREKSKLEAPNVTVVCTPPNLNGVLEAIQRAV